MNEQLNLYRNMIRQGHAIEVVEELEERINKGENLAFGYIKILEVAKIAVHESMENGTLEIVE